MSALDKKEINLPFSAMAVNAQNVEDPDERSQTTVTASPGRTLLPAPVASIVSLATRSTSFALRLGTVIGGYGLTTAKLTTLSSLELGRGILEGILSRAGNDVFARSNSELGRDNAETVLERSLESLHQTMMYLVFWTTAGFRVTETAVSSASQISQLLLSTLDQFFGSTDSSRAIASIITLIRHEFKNPATGVNGERVGVVDLMVGICGLAYLQNSCSRTLKEEARRLGQEEIVWDVVVLNDGTRADIHDDDIRAMSHRRSRRSNSNGLLVKVGDQHGSYDSSSDDDLPEINFRKQILGSLPKDAEVSISTSTTTTKVITVEVKGSDAAPLLSAPGVELIEREIANTDTLSSEPQGGAPIYRFVYRITHERQQSSVAQYAEFDDTKSCIELSDEAGITAVDAGPSGQGPPVPPKSPRMIRNPGPRAENTPDRCPSSPRTSQIPMPKKSPETAANQKRSRQPLKPNQLVAGTAASTRAVPPIAPRAAGSLDTSSVMASERKGGIRDVLKKGSMTGLANLLTKDFGSESFSGRSRSSTKVPSAEKSVKSTKGVGSNPGPASDKVSGQISKREASLPLQRGNLNFFSSQDLGVVDDDNASHKPALIANSANRPHRRRNSIISQTDTLSIHSLESRPGSPTLFRTNHMAKSKSGDDIKESASQSPQRHHNRIKSHLSLYTPSVYTLKTNSSQTSLVLPLQPQRSAYSDSEAVNTLRKNGIIKGMFPEFHILRNITRYSRYASAAYGSQFLNLMGITKGKLPVKAHDETHQDVRSFAHHTDLPQDSILLSSFVDPQGGSDATGSTDTGVPLVHTVAVDRESKAIVLACRGTLGFEDVLVDMMCDYDDLIWRGKPFKVHKGIHASARRLLYGGDGRVLYTLKEALEEFSDYGLVLCGHSLGGAVAALLATMLSEPATAGTAFVTSAQQHRRLLADGSMTGEAHQPIYLPAGRPIHVFAYGPPATMSPSLRIATRGLVTSVVHGNDLVPYLSLGVLHDLQALALAFKTDNNDAKAEVRRRIMRGFQTGISDKWYNNAPKLSTDDEDQWAYAALKTLRASMMSSKLLPPGEVFSVESTPALRRDAFMQTSPDFIGRSATRVVLKYIRDVDAHFGEIKFGASMLLDHSPGRYEDALRRLAFGVM